MTMTKIDIALIEAARRVAQRIPRFRLLIGGEGASGGWVRERQAAGDPVIALGRIDGHERALALSSADLMMVPQWVGLVAVDSLAAGVPIVTTWHGSHSPEFSYLTDGVNAAVTEHDLDEYATSIVALIGDPARRTALADRARIDSTSYSVEYPYPPWMRTALSAISIAVSEANSLAMPASISQR